MTVYCVPVGPAVAGEPLCVPVESRPAAGSSINDNSFDNPIEKAPALTQPTPPPVIEVFQ